jgi:hypothetical protein
MNKAELVNTLRKEAREIEALLKKLQARSDYLRGLAEQIEAEGRKPDPKDEPPPGKFRKIVDKIYGESR